MRALRRSTSLPPVLPALLAIAACGPNQRPADVDAAPPPADAYQAPAAGCSSDLRDVLDADGGLVESCPPDQGCADGACVPACDAAAASRGSIGCDYVIPTPSFNPYFKPACFAVFVTSYWPRAVPITVTRDGVSYDVTAFGRIAETGVPVTEWAPVPAAGLEAGQVAVLFMSDDPESVRPSGPLYCPVAPAVRQAGGTAVPGYASPEGATGRGAAWHLTAGSPVTVYDILPFGGAASWLPSAELVLPTTAWGTNYLAVVPPAVGFDSHPQWGQLVAAEDGTTVTVRASVALPMGPGVDPVEAGAQHTFQLNAGEYIQWQDSGDMSGTVLQASAPVSFVGGLGYNCYASATSTGGGCDTAHQQVPPLSAFGSTYAVAPHTTRAADLSPESIRYRLVGAVDGTALAFEPPIDGAPTTLGEGQVVDLETSAAFVVSSQDDDHPFFVAQTMSGSSLTAGTRSPHLGDEEYVNVLPPAQYLRKYVFFTDPTYATTNLVVTRRRVAGQFHDVTLDCAGQLTGWKPLGTSGDYEYTDIDLVRVGQPNGACDNGPHTATSDAPFGITVWGLDEWASYAYPAGGNVGVINDVIVLS